MTSYDLHNHTTFCDGSNTAEEMVVAAIEKGLKTLGFSGHAYTSVDGDYTMSLDGEEKYKAEICALKEKYKGKIEILCGIEQDYFSDFEPQGYDYVIGSVHSVKKDGKYYSVDHSQEYLLNAIKDFGGDFIEFCETYFELVAKIYEKTKCDIIGHFDLCSKFNGDGNKYFDETDPRYVRAGEKAILNLLKSGKPFEINTGAIHRGYRSIPYPAPHFLRFIYQNGGKVILSSDSHSTKTLCYEFDKWKSFAENIGFGF